MTEKTYAFIKNGIVVNIAIFNNPTEELLNEFKNTYELDLLILANENTEIDGEYDGVNFWKKKPYSSWLKDLNTVSWQPPIEYPGDGDYYEWKEDSLSWIKMPKGSAAPL